MQIDSIKKMIAAEQQAELIKQQASDQVRTIKREIRKTKQQDRANMEEKLEEFRQKTMLLAQEENKHMLDAIKQDTTKKCEELLEMAKKQKVKATQIVLKKVVE